MKKLCMFSMVSALMLVAGMAQALPNLLGNPGFETVPAGGAGDWNTFSGGEAGAVAQHSTLDPHSGTGHMDLQVATDGFAGMFQFGSVTFPANVGAVVEFTGWHKSLVPFVGTRELKIEWNNGNPQLRVDATEIGTEWEQFSLVGIAPPTATGATITYAISGPGEKNVYVDDFSATATPEPTSIMLGLLGLLGLVGLIRRR